MAIDIKTVQALKDMGAKRVRLLIDDAQCPVMEVEFFAPQPAVVTEPIARQSTPIGASKGMPTDDELMLWSAGGPLPHLDTEPVT